MNDETEDQNRQEIPAVSRMLGSGANKGWFLALLPLAAVVFFVSLISSVSQGEVYRVALDWVPSLGISFSFYLDGLSLLFALLVSGIGALVLIYAVGYLAGHAQLGRFYIIILVFMAAMLGLVLADNVITMFIFWELTSISSYLLIGFSHEREKARSAALQALLVTGLGGLALLAGLLLLASTGGSMELSELLNSGDLVSGSGLYLPILLLILGGAFTKSAQVPFHFWLPGAMQAPTPVSAFLHSATMVKAGIYLLARLNPVLGGTDEWHYIITLVGAATMLTGAILAFPQTDLKRILAYTTVSALGTLTLLLGLSTTLATKAAMVFLVVHSLYKGALFMVAGSIDHEVGTRDLKLLGGLRKYMPITAGAAVLAALSMAGLPPMLGFISKELLYEAKLQTPRAGTMIMAAGIAANVLMVALAGFVCLRPFFGADRQVTPKSPHEAPFSMWLGPGLLAGLGLLIGLFPDFLATDVIGSAVSAVRAEETDIKLALWHGINPVLALSAATVLTGIALFLMTRRVVGMTAPLKRLARFGPTVWYDKMLAGLTSAAAMQTRLLQNGRLRHYISIMLAFTAVIVGLSFVPHLNGSLNFDMSDIRVHEAVLAALLLAGSFVAVYTASKLAAVTALGVVGFSVAIIFLLFSAPDLAMTQFAIETLTVILLVLILYRLPRFAGLSGKGTRLRDAIIAGSMGLLITLLLLNITKTPLTSKLSTFFAENSVLVAKGRNIVNVILVDFRVLDTLGEITVLAVAALGVFALLKLRLKQGEERS